MEIVAVLPNVPTETFEIEMAFDLEYAPTLPNSDLPILTHSLRI